ncbi:MAG: hypothetical protein ACI8PZ_004268 [Myxococcota bacterium]|jgi:hypothetical protein
MILFALAGFAAAADLTVTGECPGEVVLDMTEFTPGASVALLVGDGAGSVPVPGGPCAGTDSGLGSIRTWVGPIRDLDPDGRLMLRPILPDWACEARFVLLDLATCETSPPTDFGLGGPEADPDCADNPLWTPVDCSTPEWVWSSDRGAITVDAADAARTLWSDEWGLTCSLSGEGWVSTETFVMSGCDSSWYHIGGRYTGNCGGHDGEDVKRLTMADMGCYDYRGLPM